LAPALTADLTVRGTGERAIFAAWVRGDFSSARLAKLSTIRSETTRNHACGIPFDEGDGFETGAGTSETPLGHRYRERLPCRFRERSRVGD